MTTDPFDGLELEEPAPGPTIRDAWQSYGRRKTAAGIRRGSPGDAGAGELLTNAPALLVGTDLTVEELAHVTAAFGQYATPMMFSAGPIVSHGSAFVEGILTGLELAELRRRAADPPRKSLDALGRALELAESVLELADTSLTGDVEATHAQMTALIGLAERTLEERGR